MIDDTFWDELEANEDWIGDRIATNNDSNVRIPDHRVDASRYDDLVKRDVLRREMHGWYSKEAEHNWLVVKRLRAAADAVDYVEGWFNKEDEEYWIVSQRLEAAKVNNWNTQFFKQR